jgi:hypothetical protein
LVKKESHLFDRQVKQLQPKADKNDAERLFSEHLDAANIVLLGDPGAGKTHLFKEFCQFEGGVFITARHFTKFPLVKYQHKIVYIDALDEQRSQSESLIDDIVCKLMEVQAAKVRISCRAADWLGETDLAAFLPFFEDAGEATVLALEKLTDTEVDQILDKVIIEGNAEQFRSQAKLKGVYALLNNPQTLLMLAETVKEGIWPASKTDLFDKATRLMVVEKNRSHSQLNKSSYSHPDLLQKAGAICSHLLIANAQGISTNCDSASDDFPFYGDIFQGSDAASELVLSGRLFTSVGDETVQYSHRTIAEYLGALWLKDKLAKGLALTRVLCMMVIQPQN